MPEKDGSEDKKSTKSVVNKKQKQFMNQEEQLDLSSVAESFGGRIVGEPVELNENPLAAAIPYLMGAGIIGTGAVGADSYQKMRGKPGILPDLSGVVKGVYDKIRGVHRSKKINPNVDKSFSDLLTKNRKKIKKKYGTKDGFEADTFRYDKNEKKNNNNKNKNFNKKDFGLGLGAGVGTSSIVSNLTKTKQKKGTGGFRLGGLPGTAHNVGRRTNPQ